MNNSEQFYPTPHPKPSPKGWDNCKKISEVGEALVIEALRRQGYQVLQQAQGDAAAFDLQISARIEVKTDLAATRTGNLAIELERAGEPSGLNTTTAEFWAIVVGDKALLVKVGVLKRSILAAGITKVKAGDAHKPTICALLPIANIKQFSREIILRRAASE